jgi:hypothetical protein
MSVAKFKKENNGNIVCYDAAGKIIDILPPNCRVSLAGADKIVVSYQGTNLLVLQKGVLVTLQVGSGPNVDVSASTTQQILQDLLSDFFVGLSNIVKDIERNVKADTWTTIPGNSIEFNYYAGVAAGNPSGSTDNIETAVYKQGITTVFTQTFTYNADDNVLSITVI